MLNELAQRLYEDAKEKGFWDQERNPGELLMLIVSELAEALEELRAGYGVNQARTDHHSTADSRGFPDVTVTSQGSFLHYGTTDEHKITDDDYANHGWLAKPVGVPSEMVDALIRILETMHAWGIDIEQALALKVDYNRLRGHMNGGKKF